MNGTVCCGNSEWGCFFFTFAAGGPVIDQYCKRLAIKLTGHQQDITGKEIRFINYF